MEVVSTGAALVATTWDEGTPCSSDEAEFTALVIWGTGSIMGVSEAIFNPLYRGEGLNGLSKGSGTISDVF